MKATTIFGRRAKMLDRDREFLDYPFDPIPVKHEFSSRDRAGAIYRKQIIGPSAIEPAPIPAGIDVAALATVLVTSEGPDHPIDHACDERPGPDGTCWVAGEPDDLEVFLAFDAPQSIRRVVLEFE